MGTWADAPWDNDLAAGWFNDVFRTTQFAEQITLGMNANVEDAPEIVRAAAHVVFLLGHVYLWPAERLPGDLRLAAERLQQLLDNGWQPATPLRKEIKAVKARLDRRKRSGSGKTKRPGKIAFQARRPPIVGSESPAWGWCGFGILPRRNSGRMLRRFAGAMHTSTLSLLVNDYCR